MKAFICLVALFAVAQAGYLGGVGIANTGVSSQTRAQDGYGNYQFAYNEQHATGGSSRQEAGSPYGGVVGSYSLNVGDGRQRVVKYVADGLGFRAHIATNEPGTAAQPAAATSITAPVLGVAHAAPVAVAAAAPVAVAAAPLGVAAAPLGIGIGHGLGYGAAIAAPIAKVAVAPAVSAYTSSVSHVAPQVVAKVGHGLAYGGLAAPGLIGNGLVANGLALNGLAAPAYLG